MTRDIRDAPHSVYRSAFELQAAFPSLRVKLICGPISRAYLQQSAFLFEYCAL